MTSLSAVSRRDALCLTAAAIALAPGLAHADAAAVEAELKKLYGDKKPGSGKIKIDVPQIAENGLVVPINVEVESPMTEKDHVKTVHVFADGNPLPGIASFRFTPACGKAAAPPACASRNRRISLPSPRWRMARSFPRRAR